MDLGIIGGTGLYAFPGLADIERRSANTPFGEPSGPIVFGRIGAHRVAFLARHGDPHAIAPHRVNYRANVWAMHQAGVKRMLGVNAVGGITERMAPRALVVPDQLIDYTQARLDSFSDMPGTPVEHVDFTEPYSARLRAALFAAAARSGIDLVDGGCCAVTQGPRLETRAEVARLRRDGCDLVGMTGMPEAVLAREIGIDYACLAMVANWAAGCGAAAQITLPEIFANLESTTAQLPALIAALLDGQ